MRIKYLLFWNQFTIWRIQSKLEWKADFFIILGFWGFGGDTAFIKETFPDIYALKEKDGILQPEAIADAYWFVHTQHRSAWTHELDLRPYMEKF